MFEKIVEKDKREYRFYTTPKAGLIISRVYAAVDKWNGILQQDMTGEEIGAAKKW